MRIGLLSDTELVNSNYRAYQPLAAVVRRGGHEVVRNFRDRPLSLQQLLSCDVVHAHRMVDEAPRAVIHRLHEARVGIVWDNDDDIAALPRWNPNYRRLGPSGRREIVEGVREMIRTADVVTTPSEVLAAQYRELGAKDVRVMENYLPPAFKRARPQRHDGVVVVCLASLEHHVDYEQLRMREVLEGLLEAHPDLRVLSLGLGLGLGLPPDRCIERKRVPFYELADVMACADIGIAPLVDIPWNRARSNVKLKEYAAAGLAWLASPVGPYLGMGERQGGRLVPDDGWRDALERLIVGARERRKLAKRAARWVRGEFVDGHAADWERLLRDAAERARSARAAA